MLDVDTFWIPKFEGANTTAPSKISGWLSAESVVPGFVEPTLTIVEGDPKVARLVIIAAPGAVGKSSYAKALASATKAVVVNLAQTAPLGGNFFTGGLANAFGPQALSDAADGRIGLVVDALDEAQMRAGPEGYEAGLLDLAGIADMPAALPTVLLGRALAAEEAYNLLTANGHNACLLKIEYFTDDQASRYLRNKLPLVAARSEQVELAFRTHGTVFRELAEHAREKLIAAAGCDKTNFAGYAPVLDAICEFALEADGLNRLNPQAKLAKLKATSQIDLIDDITMSILEREQGKVQFQFRERHPEASNAVVSKLYSVEEQLQHVASNLFGVSAPPPPELSNVAHHTTYREMVERFAPQHPFVSANGVPSNPVFAAYVVTWALRKSSQADLVRRAVLARPNLTSGVLFELYERQLQVEPDATMPLADVGILYQALNSQIVPGQRVQLEISDEQNGAGAPAIEVDFEILERIDPTTGEAAPGRAWGPYKTTPGTILELHSPFSNVYVDAPITVQLGDGIVQQIGAPTELTVETLLVSAKQVLVHSGGADGPKELQTVALFATQEAACDGVQTVIVRDDAALSVSWPHAQTYPWNKYVVDIPAAADEDVEFLRRRLRKILTAFRSHSKGALVRFAAKINHSRMTKDARGVALVKKLIEDGILVLFDAGKFYRLNPDVMGKILGVGYHALAQSRFTPESDSYLADVMVRVKA